MTFNLFELLGIDPQALAWTAGAVLVGLIVLALMARSMIHWVHRLLARRAHDLDREKMRARWNRITAMLQNPDRAMDKLAIIEADNLLDFVLKAMHLPGETMAFRMKFAQNRFYELKRVRFAHNVRNNVVHEPDYVLKKATAYACIKEYERALKLLGAL